MIKAFALAFAQVFDPKLVGILWRSIAAALALYGVMIGGLIWGLGHIDLAGIGWLDSLTRWGTLVGAVVLATLLFPAAVTSVMALWQDEIIAVVEARHYPGLSPARKQSLAEVAGAAVRLLGTTILVNLIMLPVYAVVVFLPPLNLIVFAAVNGALLGPEYFEAVAARRVPMAGVTTLRKAWRGRIWCAGAISAFLLSIPFVNMLAPLIATAAFVHLTQSLSYAKN